MIHGKYFPIVHLRGIFVVFVYRQDCFSGHITHHQSTRRTRLERIFVRRSVRFLRSVVTASNDTG